MKFIPIFIIFTLFLSTTIQAQEQEKVPEKVKETKKLPKLRSKYTNLSYVSKKSSDLRNYGAAFTAGKTFYLHKKPILGLLRIGLDATWVDFNYTNYGIGSYKFHQADVAVQLGASLTVTLLRRLNINAYFRVAPTYSAGFSSDNVSSGYSTYFVTGGSVSYGVIGLGAEYRFNNTKKLDMTDFSGARLYLSFRY